MVGCSRIIKTIFLILGVYLLAVNVILWANSSAVGDELIFEGLDKLTFTGYQHQYTPNGYWGFKWFFDKISTFPGLATTVAMVNKYANILSSFPKSIDNVLDAIVKVLEVIFGPATFVVTIVVDILNNVLWFLSFVWNP